MATRIANDEGVAIGPVLTGLIEAAEQTGTVLRVAARAARLAGEDDGGARAAHALVRALRGGTMPVPVDEPIDLDLFEIDPPLGELIERIRASGHRDVSMLLSGPPGTGKTSLAHHLARALDRPLLARRASDLLSPFIGGTERAIAQAFEAARRDDAILLFDEVDSLLFDRARATWEVTQVNELLTWLDRHPLPVIAATNAPGDLDPAALRRFVFKLRLAPLGRARLATAFARYFGMAAPDALFTLANLTPGDFAVVARQLRHAPAQDALDIVRRLAEESLAKGHSTAKIGF